jgi:hypothetical protein
LIIHHFFTKIILTAEVVNLKISSNQYGQQHATEKIIFHIINEVTMVTNIMDEHY